MKNLYYNGQIITLNEQQPQGEALLVLDGRIGAIGSNEKILPLKDDETIMIDLEGKTVLPGFIDPHGHIASAMALFPNFSPPPVGKVDSVEALVNEGKKAILSADLKPGQWFLGMGYDQAEFKDGKTPTKEDLDKISTEYPVVMLHTSGHVAVANSLALSATGINKDTPSPEGGIIQKHPKTLEPTGILEERAMYMAMAKIPPISIEESAKGFAKNQAYYASFGITTAQDGAFSQEAMEMVRYCQENEMMLIDVYAYPMLETSRELLQGVESATATYDRHFKIAGAKIVADGSPQAKTAWLTKPYFVPPAGEDANYRAYPIYSDDQVVLNLMKDCLKNNWQLLNHCNGDAAGDQYIRLYAQAQAETGITSPLRPVMIHAQTVREDQLDEMKRLGIMPSFFNDHVFYWGDYHLDSVLGPERGNRISPLRSALDRGMRFTLHQDNPVVPPNMMFTIHNAVNRQTRSGRKLGAEFAIDVLDAIKAVTINGAYQCFEEDTKGSLEVGKVADLVILAENPLLVDKAKLKDIKVLETIKEGKCIYKNVSI